MKNALILPASLIGAALMLTACSNATDSAQTRTSAVVQVVDAPMATNDMPMTADTMKVETKTKAVLVYADWCSSCKILDPKIKAVQAMGPIPGVEFVTLDYTDKNADNFYAQAAAAGVEAAVRAELDGAIKTGWLLLVDVDDARVLSKVTKADDAALIAAKIKAALAAS